MEFIGHGLDDEDDSPTDLYLARISSLADWRTLLDDELSCQVVAGLETPGCALFVAGDWRGLNNDIKELARYARVTESSGCPPGAPAAKSARPVRLG